MQEGNIQKITIDKEKEEQFPHDHADDTFNDIEIIIVLIKHKKLIIILSAVALIVGLVAAYLKPKVYTYSTTIEIGKSVSGKISIIESPQTVITKLKRNYIPEVIRQYVKKVNSNDTYEYRIVVHEPNKSQLIILESKGTEDKHETYITLQNEVVKRLKNDHKRITSIFRRKLDAKLKNQRSKLEEIKAQYKILAIKIKHLGKRTVLLKKQINEVKELIKQAKKSRLYALKEMTDATKAMTLLMIGNEIQRNFTRLAFLEERFYIKLENERDNIIKSMGNNIRSQLYQRQLITNTSAQIANLWETQAISPPRRSLKPTGTSRSLVVIMVVILGFVASIILAFFMEYIAMIRKGISISTNE